MAKKYRTTVPENVEKNDGGSQNLFYFGKKNYRLMHIGLVLIVLGFILMMGADANTVDGKYDPNVWNEDIFSIRRIRIAPLLVVAGFVVEAFAILKRFKD